jgi:hypothetical protein
MSGRPLLYLDIDGVFLSHRAGAIRDELTPGTAEFLVWATARFDCRWLSARCRDGNPEGALRAFRLAGGVSRELQDLLKTVAAARWKTHKTDGINLEAEFCWLDDQADPYEKSILAKCGRADRLVEVSIEPDALAVAMAKLAVLPFFAVNPSFHTQA